MIYDNAGLIQLGSEIYSITKDPFVEWIVKDTINFLARDMRSPCGGFYSALDAESLDNHRIKREGAYYVWSKHDLTEILKEKFKLAELRFGITDNGNFEDPHHKEIQGMNILHIAHSMPDIANKLQISEDEVLEGLDSIRKKMFEARSMRSNPQKDTKIITSWNALLIKSLYTTAELLDYPLASKLAKGALDFILEYLVDDEKVLRSYHIVKGDQERRIYEGVLDDYSILTAAFIQAFEYTDDWSLIEHALKVQNLIDSKFYSNEHEMYFLNPQNEDNFIHSIVQAGDDSMASGLAVMVANLFKLGKYLNDKKFEAKGLMLVKKFVGQINEMPGVMSEFLLSASNYLRYPTEIVIMNGNKTELNMAHKTKYLPGRLIYRWNKSNFKDGRPYWDVLDSKEVSEPTAYVCKGMTCSLPITTKQDLLNELAK